MYKAKYNSLVKKISIIYAFAFTETLNFLLSYKLSKNKVFSTMSNHL